MPHTPPNIRDKHCHSIGCVAANTRVTSLNTSTGGTVYHVWTVVHTQWQWQLV